MLAIQVAAGIIIAYVVIVNQKRIIQFSEVIFQLAFVALVIGVVVWVLSLGYESVKASLASPKDSKILTYILMPFVFVLGLAGVVGMIAFWELIRRRSIARSFETISHATDSDPAKESVGCAKIFLIFVLALGINECLSFPVFSYTPIGGWYDAVNVWSRSNGFADGGQLLFGLLLWQWVWIPVILISLFKRFRARRGLRGTDESAVVVDGGEHNPSG